MVFARISTGMKMLLIMTTALLPLGLIALFASIESAQKNRLQHEADARAIAETGAHQIERTVLRGTQSLRRALALPPSDGADCLARLDEIARSDGQNILYAVLDPAGRVVCRTDGFAGLPPSADLSRGPRLALLENPPALRFAVAGRSGYSGIGVLPALVIVRLAEFGTADHALALSDGRRSVVLVRGRRDLFDRQLAMSARVGSDDIRLLVTSHVNTVRAIEVLLVLLPLLMWAAAAVIGWMVVDRLVLRPLAQLQRAIADYDPAIGPLTVPHITTPSQEIRSLGNSFSHVTYLIGQHERDLENGLIAQKKLTREVHHRVKNNLQVIASLINLHSRGVSPDAAQAYASIQRRVDALAVVHRHHFAELEQNRGVSLRAMVGELAANLRATAAPEVAGMTLTLDVAPLCATQDVAVPVAFLITEIVELTMNCCPSGAVFLSIAPCGEDRAKLAIEARGLTEDICMGHASLDRFNRVVTGLARQLRAPLSYDPSIGRYEIEIPIVPPDDE